MPIVPYHANHLGRSQDILTIGEIVKDLLARKRGTRFRARHVQRTEEGGRIIWPDLVEMIDQVPSRFRILGSNAEECGRHDCGIGSSSGVGHDLGEIGDHASNRDPGKIELRRIGALQLCRKSSGERAARVAQRA